MKSLSCHPYRWTLCCIAVCVFALLIVELVELLYVVFG